ncbi:putative polyketide synthase [Rosellinia necatrix]|uniref:Putative polyketide synthase n=1 Tax=Rosellinia necatrix TaxID=77044 RepID=A0A1W2TE58_ROSNE|nr:putative polyketide synthase [Rosellinia necatrix]
MACCKCLTELLWIAEDIVEIAFRVGLEAQYRSAYIESSTESWAFFVSNLDALNAKETIERFNNASILEPNRNAYISAEGASSITVSGPPSTLNDLFSQNTPFFHARRFPLPIFSAFHAEHLSIVSGERIIKGFNNKILHTPVQHSKLLSPSSGQPYIGATFGDILLEVINEILQIPINFKTIVEELSCSLQPRTSLIRMGPVSSAKTIKEALVLCGIELVEVEDDPLRIHRNKMDEAGIAIVGMAARLPGSETLEEFWQILETGQDLHQEVRSDRFDVSSHFDSSGDKKNTTLTPYGVFIDRPGYFDTRLFNMSPREVAQTDPQQRLLLLTTYEALEMAGYQPNATPSTSTRRIGSYIGQTSDDYREVNAGQNVDTFFITGGIRAFGPGRLNYYFGWEGPSYSIDTACSSSMASIQLACSALLARECDAAIGGGANLLTSSDLFAGLSRGNFLSKTGGCKTFDEDADGYVRADGVGVVVLKRLADAIADRDNILGVIKGATTNHSADAVSITHPHAGAQERLFRSVLDKAGLHPGDIDYVELHGTGTQAGDVTESKSVINVFGHGRSSPLYIGTVKPNLGHGEAASGVTSLMKALMMFKKNTIPPHIGIKNRMNQKLPPLAEFNTFLSFGNTDFSARANGDGKRRILINNFDAAGGNTSMIVEEGPKLQVQGIDPRHYHAVVVSAKTSTAFVNNTRRLLEYVIENPHTRLQDIAYTTTARRMHHALRQGHAVSSLEELSAALRRSLESEPALKTHAIPASPIFIFTGQGSFYIEMASELFKTHVKFKESICAYERVCLSHGFNTFVPLITDKTLDASKATPQQIQLAIVSIELAIAELWKSLGVSPSAVVGHSLGEYPALYTAGVISLSDCLYLVGKRADIMESECTPGTHSMLVVKETAAKVEDLLWEHQALGCEIACANSPQSTVISGEIEQIRHFQQAIESQAVRATRLGVQYAFHSAQMESILGAYRNITEKVHFGEPAIPFASTLLGDIVTEKGTISADYLERQTRERVQFAKALSAVQSNFAKTKRIIWIETGPNPLCLGLVRATLGAGEVLLPSLKRGESDWKVFSESVAKAYSSGINIDWPEYHRPFNQSVRLLELPKYAFDLKNYWIQYEGDWALRKGEPAIQDSSNHSKPTFSTTGLHRIESEIIDSQGITVIFVTEASEPKLNKALRGHLVNGAGLCSSSVYADMAFTAASYLQERTSLPGSFSMDVRDMNVHKPLIIQAGNTAQIIRVLASQNSVSGVVEVKFSSQDGKVYQDHAHCTVAFGDGSEWKSDWARNAYLVKARMDHLTASSLIGQTHKILRPLAYKLFRALVDYDSKYQGMEEVYLDSNLLEATAHIKFAADESDGHFMYSPYWIDSITHLSGFVLNGADTTPDDRVFISHGWRSLRIVGQLSASARYQNYVRMQDTNTPGVLSGDVYLFEQDRIIAVCEGLKFQSIKRAILDHLIPPTAPGTLMAQKLPTIGSVKQAVLPERIDMVRQKGKSVTESSDATIDIALAIIASEVGIDLVELSDDSLFSDFGVDSLLSLSIVAKLGAAFGEDVPAQLFSDCLTVHDLRKHFAIESSEPHVFTNDSTDSSSMGVGSNRSTNISTPEPYQTKTHLADELRKIIAQEAGLEVQEIDEETPLFEYGVDSLLSLSILATINSTGMGILPPSFLIDHPTLASIRESLSSTPPVLPEKSTEAAQEALPRKAEAVLLQQGSGQKGSALFLLPDGSGSAASYMGLPQLGSPGGVYGLNSPFLSAPEAFGVSLEATATMYVTEIRRIQPRGPYRLGGWSIGGTYAFEAALQLAREHGEQVEMLVLIDAPCPAVLPPLPLETIDLLSDLGVIAGPRGKGPAIRDSVRRHFQGSVNALRRYKATAIPQVLGPKAVVILWAEKGVRETVGEACGPSYGGSGGRGKENNAASDWIMDRRHDYGPNGWDSLLAGSSIRCETVVGDHFSMMRKPAIVDVGYKLIQALGCV